MSSNIQTTGLKLFTSGTGITNWVLSKSKIAALKQEADTHNKTIYLCGVSSGEDQCWQYFDQVIALVIDADTLEHRIRNRDTNQFGKSEQELSEILSWHANYSATYRKFGANIIDATQPLRQVVDEILSLSQHSDKSPSISVADSSN